MKRIAFLTSGGDCPGMNAAIRSIVKSCLNQEIIPFAIKDGFKGLLEGDFQEMNFESVNNIIHRGGTILGTARCSEFKEKEQRQKGIDHLKKHKIDGLIVIGGDGSFTGATVLSKECNIAIIGIPGTIDNDIYGTDHTIGYDTALNTVVDAVDKIRDTASSHHRIFFIEVMGRNAGFIALNSAIASGAETVLIPEEITDIEKLVSDIKKYNKGKRSSIVIVAEGDDAGGANEIVAKVKPFLQDYDLRTTILGHVQRGGNPSAFDRIIATRMGDFAVQLLIQGETKKMTGIQGEELHAVSIEKAIKMNSTPDLRKLDLMERMRTKGE